MRAWLLSIVGVVLLIAIAEMLLPEGRLRASIRGVFAIVLMLVILRPLPSFGALMWSNAGEGPTPDAALLDRIDAQKLSALETDAQALVETLGASGAVVRLRVGSEKAQVVGADVCNGPSDPSLRATIRTQIALLLGIDENEVKFP